MYPYGEYIVSITCTSLHFVYFRKLLTLFYSIQVSLLEPWRAEKAEEWDKISLSEFIDKLCWTR